LAGLVLAKHFNAMIDHIGSNGRIHSATVVQFITFYSIRLPGFRKTSYDLHKIILAKDALILVMAF
jgi:hypothetical protein